MIPTMIPTLPRDQLLQVLNDLRVEAPAIVYHDHAICVAIKPPSMFVHPSELADRSAKKDPTLMHFLRTELKTDVFPIHRIDRASSGLVLFGLNSKTARSLSRQFVDGDVVKKYVALVRGHFPTTVVLSYPLTNELSGSIQSAQSDFSLSARSELSSGYFARGVSLVDCTLHTGRRHQLRRHLAHMRFPIAGDVRHGDGKFNSLVETALGRRGLHLYATQLSIKHPDTGDFLTFSLKVNDYKSQTMEVVVVQLFSDK